MRLYGLLGKKLEHSFSPRYFSEKFSRENISDAIYKAFPLSDITAFPQLLQSNPKLCGLNVTIPYKEAIIPYLHELSEAAERIGAVNCIEFLADNRLRGHNTDVLGFGNHLKSVLEGHSHLNKALVLGNGGAAKAVCFALKSLDIDYTIVSRKSEDSCIAYSQVDFARLAATLLVINTTPLGMFPEIDSFPPIPYEALGQSHILYDLVYNPEETLFMKKGAAQGAKTCNGLQMLHGQAEAAWAIWNQRPII